MIVDKKHLEQVAMKKYLYKHWNVRFKMIDDAVDMFKKNCEFELMHCVSAYPLIVNTQI